MRTSMRALILAAVTAASLVRCGGRSDLLLAPAGDAGEEGAEGAIQVDARAPESGSEAAPEDADTACDAGIESPRPIAPLSTSTVTSQRPVLRWVPASGTDGAQVDVCRDRACASLVMTFGASGASGEPPSALAAGLYYWRLRGTRSGSVVTPASPTWQFSVGARSAAVNTSWGTVLDVNGDGFADVAVGAWGATGFTGRVYVYLGGPNGLATTPATTLTGPDGPGYFGSSLASAGDVNGDGFADLVVGAYDVLNFDGAGAVYLYLGGATGLSATPFSAVRGAAFAKGYLGISVASAGDVNGDGYADVIVASLSGSTVDPVSHAQLYVGGPCGLSQTAASSVEGPLAHPGAHGIAVASAGDVNGDGLGDVLVGANGTDVVSHQAFLYLGGASGLATTPDAVLTAPDGPGSISGAVATAGDVNGDGFADVVLGSDRNGGNLGHAYVYMGGAGGLSTSPVATLTEPPGGNGAFGISVANAGDVNGDGFGDVVVGGGGHAYLFLGGAGGVATTAGVTLTGSEPNGGDFGNSAAGAGDVNGDGFADVVIGAAGEKSGAGGAYAYRGSASGLSTAPATTFAGVDGVTGAFGASVAMVLPTHVGVGATGRFRVRRPGRLR